MRNLITDNAESDHALHSLSMSHEKDARLKWTKDMLLFFFFLGGGLE